MFNIGDRVIIIASDDDIVPAEINKVGTIVADLSNYTDIKIYKIRFDIDGTKFFDPAYIGYYKRLLPDYLKNA